MQLQKSIQKLLSVLTVFSLLFTLPTFGRSEDSNDKKISKSSSSTKLDDKENPELIGKRNINKGTIQFYSIEKEMAIGRQLANDLDRQLKFINDPVVTEYINRVGQNIALNSDAKFPFTIKVVDSNEVNAFALPGGFFYVNKGLILAADNEDELACVMAHEIAHVAARHATEQVSKGQLLQFGSIPLIFLGGIGGVIAQNAANILVPLTFLKFSRGAESEADTLGAGYAWASGYDPNGLIVFFERLQTREKKQPGTIAKLFSTHPTNGDRIIRVQKLIDRFPKRDEYVITTAEFNRVKARLGTSNSKRRLKGGSGDDNSPRKPTLKRRNPTDSGHTDDTNVDRPESEPRDKPTLKRRNKEQNEEPSSSKQDDL